MNSTSESEIRNLMTDLSKALHNKDAKRVLSHYAPDSVVFDLAPPLKHEGSGAASEQGLREWFATWQGPIGHETRDVSITANADIAYCHGSSGSAEPRPTASAPMSGRGRPRA